MELRLDQSSICLKLAAIVDRGLAKVITIPNKIGAHSSKLLISDCTVTLIELIDGPLEGFSNFGCDVFKGCPPSWLSWMFSPSLAFRLHESAINLPSFLID
jgi:hypothetical protein